MRSNASRRLRRLVVGIVAVCALPVLAGATYQGVVTSLERREFPRPGGLVEVGNFQLHIHCAGEGSPVVVLEASAGAMSPAWGWVQPASARLTRTCSYDRAGLGWSESQGGLYLPLRAPDDLHLLLTHAGERGPFVIVGHELGAAFARMFAGRYPADTAALVLVDDPTTSEPHGPPPAMASAWPWLARIGILRATGGFDATAAGLPGTSGGAMRAFLHRPDHLTRAAMEITRVEEVEAAARAAHLDAALPVASVTVGRHEQPAVLATQEESAIVTRAIEATVTRLRTQSAPGRDASVR